MTRRSVLLTLAAVLATTVPAQAQLYDIKIRKSAQGDVMLMEKTGTEENKTILQDNTGKDVMDLSQPKKTHHYVFTETVVAKAAGADKATKLTRKYTKAESSEGGKDGTLPYQGKTVLIEKKGEKYEFRIEGGGELTGKDAEALDKEFNGKDKGGPDFEKMILPNKKVAVGESWKIDTEPLLKEMAKSGELVPDPTKFTMSAKLTKAYTKDGRQFGVIRLEWNMGMKGVGGGGKSIPVDPAKNKMTVTADLDICIDGSASVGTMTASMAIDMMFPIPDQPLRAIATIRGTSVDRASLPTK
jgi:hypothetical protein